MSKKNRNAEIHTEPPAAVEAAPVTVEAQALATLDEKERVITAEVDKLSLALGEAKSRLKKVHQLRKQLNAVLGIVEEPPAPAEA